MHFTYKMCNILLKSWSRTQNIETIFHIQNIRCMAGHSKWQNIRHIKGTKDTQRGQAFDQIIRRLREAIITGGSAKPEFNSRLAYVLEDAKRHNMPKETINRSIERFAASSSSNILKMFEAKAPGGCMLLIDAYVDNERLQKNELNSIFKKFRARMLDKGQAMHAFDHKAIVTVPVTGETDDLDSMVDVAIECGAEDVGVDKAYDDSSVYEFVCSGPDKHSVKKALESRGMAVSSIQDEYIPHVVVTLSTDDQDTISRLMDKLNETEFVVNVYDNTDLRVT